MDSRASAVEVIEQVIKQHSPLDQVLQKSIQDAAEQQDQAFIQDLCYGVFRWYGLLESWLESLTDKPLKAKDSDIKHLIMVGLYQIAFQRTPDHAAVSATVNSCRTMKKNWAKNMVNAVLRRFLREHGANSAPDLNAMIKAHPKWMLQQLQEDWPEHWQVIIQANQSRAPLTLRTNLQQCTRQQLQQRWQTSGIDSSPTAFSPTGLNLHQATDVRQLPGYLQGDFSVQDQAAQFAAELLQLKSGKRLLDACAAPGGKTTHCLETCPQLAEVIAIDNDAHRLKRLEENLTRLNLNATIVQADASQTKDWWDQLPFDRILLDAPCTASGVIRRHPDIKYHRQAADLVAIQVLQNKILQNLWPMLRPGGKLVYSTCSVLKQENDAQISRFLATNADAEIDTITHNWGFATEYGRQILPGNENMDGFYYCRLIKT